MDTVRLLMRDDAKHRSVFERKLDLYLKFPDRHFLIEEVRTDGRIYSFSTDIEEATPFWIKVLEGMRENKVMQIVDGDGQSVAPAMSIVGIADAIRDWETCYFSLVGE